TTATGRCLTMSLQTDRDSYSPGQKLSVTVTGTNNTSAACGGARELVCGGPALAIRDASGTAVFTRQPPVRVCPMLIRLLQPGETQQMTVAIELPALAPGIYSLVAAPGAEALGSHYFRIC
ncbi:MAG: hypothetical protein M3Z13_04530, partial [Candidatus Dormibacteraeota bacterium]|nr:hypothetical protein [Candidatus Dormibacteraeota bacterium]